MSRGNEDLLGSLLEYLRDVKEDYETGLTPKKMARAYGFDSSDGVLTFMMERHAAILGGYYEKGLGMPAFSTRVETYKYVPDSRIISVIEVSEPVVDLDDIDYGDLAEQYTFDMSFDFEFDREQEKFKMTENCINFEKYVSDLDEALASAEELVDFRAVDPVVDPELANFSQDVLNQIQQQIYQANLDILQEMIRDAWEERRGGPEGCG